MLDYKKIIIFLANLDCGPRFISITLANIKALAFQKYCNCTLNKAFLPTRRLSIPRGENLYGNKYVPSLY